MAITDGYRFESSPRWVRTVLNGTTVADSRRVKLLWEPDRLPVYCFPAEDVRMDLLRRSGEREDDPKGPTALWTVQVGDRVAADAAWSVERPSEGCPDISGYVVLSWRDMDTWYEEDDEVYVHPRDPYHRVDVMRSSRHVRVEMLVPSSTMTQCPYKGRATYFGVRVGNRLARDLVWTYQFPIPECTKIENLLCFYDERVDAVYVDGERQEKPVSPWSRPPVIVDVE